MMLLRIDLDVHKPSLKLCYQVESVSVIVTISIAAFCANPKSALFSVSIRKPEHPPIHVLSKRLKSKIESQNWFY